MRNPVLEVAVGSDIGRRYSANFDVTYLRAEPLLAVVADGMGDGAGSAVAAADARVAQIGRELRSLAGCTLTAIVATPHCHWLVQIGDSRLYRLRGELLELLTTDHTMDDNAALTVAAHLSRMNVAVTNENRRVTVHSSRRICGFPQLSRITGRVYMKIKVRRLAMAATVIAASAITLGFPTAAASADPGRCGVGVTSSRDEDGGKGSFIYLVRNDCSVSLNFRVYQYTIERDAQAPHGQTCQWINPHDTATFWDPVGDSTWQALAC
ncbi:hypothetical protein ACIBCN_04220 [Nocardia sp. NPDC051052]|uniref:hypothetical protein n=1 Tax=Nocardia sp. NPDC051052 TaxID=3364322 RepID=UPI0037A45156